jgi:hypothetical protein
LLKGNFEKAKEDLVEFKSKFYGGEEKETKAMSLFIKRWKICIISLR